MALASAAISACGTEPEDGADAGSSGTAGTRNDDRIGSGGSGGSGAAGRSGATGNAGSPADAGEAGSGGTGGSPDGGTAGSARPQGGTGGTAAGSGGRGNHGGEGGEGGHGGGGTDAVCGNGIVEGDETCDDRNSDLDDGCVDCAVEQGWVCDAAAPSVCSPRVVAIGGGGARTCAVLGTGKMLCWGSNGPYSTGYGDWHNTGDDETPASIGPLPIPLGVRDVAMGRYHICALYTSGAVRCWGAGDVGELGYANTDIIDDASLAREVDVGGPVQQVVCGEMHTCALLTNGKVRCWGAGDGGALGYGNSDYIGDNETPASAGDVDIGGPVQQLAAGTGHTCALLTNGKVRCWGNGAYGELGYGNTDSIGFDDTPAEAGDVDVGGDVREIAAGETHTCALLTNGKVRCWGSAAAGLLGYGNAEDIGDNEVPAAAGDVDLGVLAEHIVAGDYHTCILTAAHTVHCWGQGPFGATGYGTATSIGDDELPSSMGAVSVGGPVELLTAGREHTCAVLARGNRIRCWGRGDSGELGYASVENVGDDELPSSVGFVEYFTARR